MAGLPVPDKQTTSGNLLVPFNLHIEKAAIEPQHVDLLWRLGGALYVSSRDRSPTLSCVKHFITPPTALLKEAQANIEGRLKLRTCHWDTHMRCC